MGTAGLTLPSSTTRRMCSSSWQASPDFSLAVSSKNTVTVTPGQTANYALTLSPLSGFSQTVQLSCSGGPPQSTCTVTPSSVTLTGTGSATAKVEVVTAADSARTAYPAGFPREGNQLALWLALLVWTGSAR